MAYEGPHPFPVKSGGSGATTLTGVLIGNDGSAFTAESPLTQAHGGSGSTNFTGNLTLITQATPTAVASQAFTSWTTGYQYYIFELLNVVPASGAGPNFDISVSTDGGSTYASHTFDNCGWEVTSTASTAGFLETSGGASATYNLIDGVSNAAPSCINGRVLSFGLDSATFYKTFQSKVTFSSSNATNAFGVRDQNIQVRLTTAVNGIKFAFTAGNIASGTINFYGVN